MRFLTAGIVALAALLAVSAQAIHGQQGKRSIWLGVYTDAQAERGHIQYLQSCATCHMDDLKGDSAEEVPGLATERFIEGWSGHTVKDLVDTIRRTMPGNSPGSLSPDAYVDLVAFILKSNQVPSGPNPLEPATLDTLLIETPKR